MAMSSLVPALGRRLAGLLIALLVGATALPPALHADMDDLACEFGAAQSARTTHADANDRQDASLHCEVCHWLRTIRTFDLALTGAPAISVTVTPIEAVAVPVPLTASFALCASRAPPLA
jgi:hypothetical protein